ncbi:MAG TPA: hypothetical protein VJ812_03370 [Gemmatimonadaceae bacterium]|nr:hypothetical protein [Gemmatimonadaceae bacterium]
MREARVGQYRRGIAMSAKPDETPAAKGASQWTPRPLRIGLLTNTMEQPRWALDALRQIQEAGCGTIEVVVMPEVPPQPSTSRVRSIIKNREYLLYHLYNRLDTGRFRREPDPFTAGSLEPFVRGAEIVRLTPRQTQHCDYFEDADVERIKAYDLDVAIRFGFRILKGRALDIARFGVWSYHHGDNLVNRGGPPGFWEVMEGTPVTGSILQVLTEKLDGGQVLYRSWASTDQLSVVRNQANFYRKTSTFLARKLCDLHREGPSALQERGGPRGYVPYTHRLYTQPRNGEMMRLLARLGWRFARHKLHRVLSDERWALAYVIDRSHQDGAAPVPPTLYRSTLLAPPKGAFWADPFVVSRGDRYYVFFEEWLDAAGKAHISCIEIDAKGKASPPRKVLECDYHLSYPFTFEWRGTQYMIPETGDNRTVELWRAVEFPDRWELDRVLMRDIYAVDATLEEIDGRWWMFANVAPVEGASTWDELHLFHADSPLGPWQPHRRNPVKSDVRSARPAGRLIRAGGDLYRPSQDCSASYGHGLVINRITRLDLEAFEEVEVARLHANWRPDLTGMHTINAAGGMTVVDVRLKRPRLF